MILYSLLVLMWHEESTNSLTHALNIHVGYIRDVFHS